MFEDSVITQIYIVAGNICKYQRCNVNVCNFDNTFVIYVWFVYKVVTSDKWQEFHMSKQIPVQ